MNAEFLRASAIDGSANSCPERALWAEVLFRAFEEAVGGVRTGCDIHNSTREHANREALSFCTASGEWGQSRETLCTLLDIDPERFRRVTLEAIELARTGKRVPGLGAQKRTRWTNRAEMVAASAAPL